MARRGQIEIPIALDTSLLEKGVQNGLIEPFGDAQEALEKLGDTNVGRDIDRDLQRGQDATEDLSTELRDTRDQLGQLGFAAKSAADTGSTEMKKFGGVTRAMGTDIRQAGDAIGDIIEGRFAGAAHSLMGATTSLAQAMPGLGVGIAAATALGLPLLNSITEEVQRQEREAEKLEARLAGAYKKAAEEGRNYLDVAQFIDESNDLRFNPDRAEDWKQLQADANLLRMEEGTLIKASIGDLEALGVVQQEVNKHLETAEAHVRNYAGVRLDALTDEAASLRDRWQETGAAAREYADAAANSARITSEFLKEAINDAEGAARAVDEFGNELYELPDGMQVVIDAETGQAHQDLDRFKGDLKSVGATVVEPLVRVRVDTTAWDRWTPEAKAAVVNANPNLAGWYSRWQDQG